MRRRELLAARKALGLSQTAFGKALGLHQQTVHKYESGELPVPRAVELAVLWLLEHAPQKD